MAVDTRKPQNSQPWPGTAGAQRQAPPQGAPKAPPANGNAKPKPPADERPRERIDVVRALCRTKMRSTISALLAKGQDVDRFAYVFLMTVESNADLVRCTDGSLARAMMHSAEVGLEVGGPYPHAYLIPYKAKRTDGNGREQWVDEAQFQISVWGYLELVRRSGGVKKVWADVVCKNDVCELVSGTDGKQIKHKPLWFSTRAERGPVVGAYACALLENGETVFEPVSREELDAARAANKGKTPAWDLWPEQQMQKVALKRLSKYLPKGEQPIRGLDIDEDPSTPAVIDVAGVPLDIPPEVAEATAGSTPSPTAAASTDPLDEVISRSKPSEGHTIDRAVLFQRLCDADESYLPHRALVDGLDEMQALQAAAWLNAILRDLGNGEAPEMPAFLRLEPEAE